MLHDRRVCAREYGVALNGSPPLSTPSGVLGESAIESGERVVASVLGCLRKHRAYLLRLIKHMCTEYNSSMSILHSLYLLVVATRNARTRPQTKL